jgi:glycosyltransferase involved in cell wall biosynthesis
VVVELAAAARRAGIEATFSLVGPDSGSLSRVESTIRDYGLERTVTYEGPVAYDAVRSRMRGSQVFVLPSVDEPFPMSLLEAMSVGLAPVCTTSCGIADELKRCGGAVVADPSVDRFIEAALPVLSDPMLRRELSEKARACAEASFPWRSVIATLESVYAG